MRLYDNLSTVSQFGFTLIEMMIVITIIIILAAMAFPYYQDYIIKSQVSESFNIAYGLKTSIATNLQQGTCFANGAMTANSVDTLTAKYGTAVITADTSGLPPCGIQYIFNSSSVSSSIQGKTISFNVNNNGVLEKSLTTTVDDKYLPQAIK